jgi:hypothetical protein
MGRRLPRVRRAAVFSWRSGRVPRVAISAAIALDGPGGIAYSACIARL